MIAYSFWDAIWLIFISFLFVSVLMTLFSVIVDLFRDDSLSGGMKALWVVILIIFPLLGMLVYLIARGQGMSERALKQQVDAKQSFDTYVREVAGGGAASELEKAKQLHTSGAISDEEFTQLKRKILA